MSAHGPQGGRDRGVAYLTSGRFLPRELTAENSARTLTLVGALLAAGALAVKHETSILAHGRDEWLALAADGGPIAQRKAWVRMPLGAPGVLYSCGMHLVGRPDVEIEHDGNPDRLPEWVGLMSALADYQLTEERGTEMADGEGFRMAPDLPRWTLHRTACDRYEEGDLSHNPYGYWRLREDEAASSGD